MIIHKGEYGNYIIFLYLRIGVYSYLEIELIRCQASQVTLLCQVV